MAEKRMLIVDSDLIEKIDKNRGELSRLELINFLIENLLNEQSTPQKSQYIERKEFQRFAGEMKELLRRFLDFFMSRGMQTSDNLEAKSFEELTQKLQLLANNGAKSKSV